MRRILHIIWVVCIVFIGLFSPVYAEENSLSIVVNNNECLVGEEVIVEIIANEFDMAGADIEISYDSKKLQLIEKNIFVENTINIQDYSGQNLDIKDSEGVTKILFGLNKDSSLLQGQHTLASIVFKATETGQASIGFNSSQLAREILVGEKRDYIYTDPQLSQSLTININKLGEISGVIEGSDNYSMEGAVITLKKDGVQETATLENSEYNFTALEDGIYSLEVSLSGYEIYAKEITVKNGADQVVNILLDRIIRDANRDGVIGLEDLVAVASKFGLTNEAVNWNSDLDINGDGTIDILDLVNITRFLQ